MQTLLVIVWQQQFLDPVCKMKMKVINNRKKYIQNVNRRKRKQRRSTWEKKKILIPDTHESDDESTK